MSNLSDMIWVESRKALRSRVPLWTILGSQFMPLGIAFLIFVARNPAISQKLGLVSVKADLIAYSATDWSSYLGFTSLIVAGGGLFMFVLALSWIFGREFADGTIKDMLAVPVQRSSILLAKFIVAAIWSVTLALTIFAVSLIMGAVIKLPGGSISIILHGGLLLMSTAILAIVVALPFAFIASAGRGYLLPLGVVVLLLMMTNLVALAGWGEYFPWAVPGLFAQAKSPLTLVSFGIVLITGLAGMAVTYLWWKYADQNR